MPQKLSVPNLSSTIICRCQRLLNKLEARLSRYDTERNDTDDLLERMSLRELGDLPLGPEPCFTYGGKAQSPCRGRNLPSDRPRTDGREIRRNGEGGREQQQSAPHARRLTRRASP